MRVSGEDWVLANTNVSGYFRVNYDLDNWDRLLSLLNTNHQVSHKPFPVCALCPHLDGMTTKDYSNNQSWMEEVHKYKTKLN